MSRPTRGCDCFLPVRGCHPLWPPFPECSGSYNRITGLIRFRSPLLAESLLMSFPPGTEMFQFPGFASSTYGFSRRSSWWMGFPHSEISGSKCIGNSPELIAAYHVLHRLSVPRHPPNALVVLDLTFCQRSDDHEDHHVRLVPCRGRPPPRQRALFTLSYRSA